MSSFINPYKVFKNLAFKMDAETAHHLSIQTARTFPGLAKAFVKPFDKKKYALETAHLKVPFPVGLAAGLDKNAECIDFFHHLQFGFIEVGTVTPKPQLGNEKPRLFRLPEHESLRNRMGFNNLGMDEVYDNVLAATSDAVVGVNLGKNKDTPENLAIEDYLKLYKKFKNNADYLVVNISSPNTAGLRDLQNENFLQSLMTEFKKAGKGPAVFLKLAPDLEDNDLIKLTELAIRIGFNGLIATNTCLRPDIGEGGISGKLLTQRAAEVRKQCLAITKSCSDFDFIGVGGISSFADLWQYWLDGGKLAQVYTAFIYQGPALLESIRAEIDKKLNLYSLSTLDELLFNINDLD